MNDQHRFFRPNVPNPYPDGFNEITDFEYITRLVLAREPEAPDLGDDREATYIVAEPYTVRYKIDGRATTLTVPRGLLTDLASVPQFARGVVGRVGPHLEASIVHDYLFVAWQLLPDRGARRRDFEFANQVMFAGLESGGVPGYQQVAIRAALNFPWVSWSVYRETDDPIFVKLDERFAATETGVLPGSGTA